MQDSNGRIIDYLRISVTTRCNLRCIYCFNSLCKRRYDPLTIKNYRLITGICADLGIKKVRLTGGEPLMRADIVELTSEISKVPGIQEVSISTNGIRLGSFAERLKLGGLKRVNVSLDSMDRNTYKLITGADKLKSVLKGIEKALEVGFDPVKINTVLIRGVNDREIDSFIMLTKQYPIDVRFIEMMPIGSFGEANRNLAVNNRDIISRHPELKLYQKEAPNQPARYYKIDGYSGRVGFISPISNSFCDSCNRIRLTADGRIKACLGSNMEYDLKKCLKDSVNLKKIICGSIFNKPLMHEFSSNYISYREMLEIGG